MDVTQRAITRLLPLSTRAHVCTYTHEMRAEIGGNGFPECVPVASCSEKKKLRKRSPLFRKTSRRLSPLSSVFVPVFLSRACTSLSIALRTPTMTIATVTRSNTRLRKRPRDRLVRLDASGPFRRHIGRTGSPLTTNAFYGTGESPSRFDRTISARSRFFT